MEELEDIKAARSRRQNILLVVDAMIGQDAVHVAARSTSASTSRRRHPHEARRRRARRRGAQRQGGHRRADQFLGIGETLDKLEEFRPDGMASRILGMGDVVGLMKDFEQVVDEKKAEEDAERMLEGHFTLDDFLEQIRMIQKMGSLKDLVEKMPGFGGDCPRASTSTTRSSSKSRR